MPKKFEVRDFAHFEELLKKLGFARIPSYEVREELQRLGKHSRRPITGREIGFRLAVNGLIIKVWTSRLEEEQKFRDLGTDAGWILIVQDGKAAYFSRPKHRTENFLLNLYRWIFINWERVTKRPKCLECGQFMKITKRYGALKARFWSCAERGLHPSGRKRHSLDFNFALSERAKNFLKQVYKKRARRQRQLKKEGKKPLPAILGRRKWIAKSEPPKI